MRLKMTECDTKQSRMLYCRPNYTDSRQQGSIRQMESSLSGKKSKTGDAKQANILGSFIVSVAGEPRTLK